MGGDEREERKEVRGGGRRLRRGKSRRKAAAASLRSFILHLLANTSGFAGSTPMRWVSGTGSHL